MASTDKFCLRWKEFETNVGQTFRELREESDFNDVTLACEDKLHVSAHKVILSACSPFFRSILKNNPHQHPLLYLKGIKYRALLAVLDFMYLGEVSVAQDDLNVFLTVAQDLQVKGLTLSANGDSTKIISEPQLLPECPRPSPVLKRLFSHEEEIVEIPKAESAEEDVLYEAQVHPNPNSPTETFTHEETPENTSDNCKSVYEDGLILSSSVDKRDRLKRDSAPAVSNTITAQPDDNVQLHEQAWQCTLCKRMFSTRRYIINHMKEDHHITKRNAIRLSIEKI